MNSPSTASESSSGIVVLCNSQGMIVKVVHDGLDLTSRLKVGQPFTQVISAFAGHEPDSETEAARRFMATLCASGFAAGWEIEVPVAGHLATLSFTGGATDDGMLIVGKAARSDARHLVEELMRINNETVNAMRAAMKQTALSAQAQRERDSELLAELSRANNEVITAQRELAKKNAMLSRANAALEEARAALEAKQAALEEANARLDALATTDGLTGVNNRRSFEQKLAEEISRSTRYRTPFSLLLLDVDKFKQYNDTFGHLAGDDVLKTVARLLRDYSRTMDFVARYGGEEFALLLPNTDTAGAMTMAERLRCALETASWPERAITASFGAATLSGEINTSTALIAAADRALYASKESGRNRVTHVSSL